MINRSEFIEYVNCFGNFYGTSILAIQESFKKYKACIMDLEWNGAFRMLHGNLLEQYQKIGILILPPSITTLRTRLNNRGSETNESLKQRIDESFKVQNVAHYNYAIINNDINDAYNDLTQIFMKHCRS